jgi:hypothetical protein
MDFLYWGGPVTKELVEGIQWERPTYVWCNPLGGMDNAKFYQSLVDEGYYTKLTPLQVLLMRAQHKAAQQKIPFFAAAVGSIGLATFSAGHQLINPLLMNPADAARVSILVAVDSCFVNEGVKTPHKGYAAFGKLAVDPTSGKMMVVTSHGPRGAIHYKSGTYNFDLMSGTSSFQLVWDAVSPGDAGITQEPPSTAPGKPTESHRVGNLIWYGYDDHDHEWQVKSLARPMISAYAPPFLSRGIQSCEVALPVQVSSKPCIVGKRTNDGLVAAEPPVDTTNPNPAPMGEENPDSTSAVVGGMVGAGVGLGVSAVASGNIWVRIAGALVGGILGAAIGGKK